MHIIKLEVKDDYFENTLLVLNGLKDVMIDKISTSYTASKSKDELEYFQDISVNSLKNDWDNKEDDVYDRFLK